MIVFSNIKLSIYMEEVATAKVYVQHVQQKTLLTFWTMIHSALYVNDASRERNSIRANSGTTI